MDKLLPIGLILPALLNLLAIWVTMQRRRGRRARISTIIIIWGISSSLQLIGGVVLLIDPQRSIAYFYIGIGFMLFTKVPCGLKIFNTNPRLKFLRNLTFFVGGLIFIVRGVIALGIPLKF